jgi:hypothetical protein
MNRFIKYIFLAGILYSQTTLAGNPDRAGGAGATQLLINPYARSAGMIGANSAYLKGCEAMHFNVGGLAFGSTYEGMLSTVSYLQGTGIRLSNASLAIPVGEAGENVIGLSFTGMSFGDIPITTETQPNGTLGTYTPSIINLGLAYSRRFSNSISAGILIRYVSEGLSNVSASGLCFDGGVQYQTALNPKDKIKKEDFRFGMSVRNLGSDLSYSGSGLSFKATIPTSGATRTTYMGAETFNLPALVNIGVAYDIRLDNKKSDTYNHRLTTAGNFNYNAFSQNFVSAGGEYAFKELFMIRGALVHQGTSSATTSVMSIEGDNTNYLSYALGCTLQMPITANGLNMGIDYAYNPTRVFSGIHNLTLRISIGYKKS